MQAIMTALTVVRDAGLLDELRQRRVGAAQRFVDRGQRSHLLLGDDRRRPAGERVVRQRDFPEAPIEAAGGQPAGKLHEAVVAAHDQPDHEHEDDQGSNH
jgi:hypothetical protein